MTSSALQIQERKDDRDVLQRWELEEEKDRWDEEGGKKEGSYAVKNERKKTR